MFTPSLGLGKLPRPWPRSTVWGLALWGTAVALALRAQYLLTPLNKVDDGALLYALASVLSIIGTALIDRRAPLPDPSTPANGEDGGPEANPAPSRSLARLGAGPLVVAGLGMSGASVYLLEARQAYGQALWLWIAALIALVAGMSLTALGRRQSRPPRVGRWQVVEVGVVLATLALTVALRLPDLAQIPPEVHGDEAAIGLEGRRIISGQVRNPFGVGWYNVPIMSFAIPVPFMLLFGDNLYGLRMASVFQGTLSLLLLYLIVKKLFSARVAAVAAFLLAVSQWDIHFSRTGFVYMQAQFAGLLLFYLLLRGIESRRAVCFLLAGFAVGFCLSVYFAARLAPGLAGLYLLHKVASERGFFRRQRRGLLALAVGALVFVAPTSVFYVHNLEAFVSRAQGVFVFSPENLQHEYYSKKVNRVEDVLWLQTIKTVAAFNLLGEASLQYGHRAPLIDYWTSAPFVLGVAVATLRPHRARYFFLATWLWLTLLTGSVLTVDAVFSPHLLGVVPTLFVFPALVVDAGWRGTAALFGRVGLYAFALPVAAFLILAARTNYDGYFELHVKKLQPAGFSTTMSRYIMSVNDRYRVYLIGKPDTSLRYDTARFLVPNVDGVDVRDQPLALPIDRVPAAKGVAFVVEHGAPNAGQRLAAIEGTYPNGREELHKTTTGVPLFYSYVVERESLLAAKPDAVIDHSPIRALLLSQLNVPVNAPSVPAATQHAKPLLRLADLGEPRAVAVDATGSIYVVDRRNAVIRRFGPDGGPLGSFSGWGEGDDLLKDPRAVAIGRDGTVLVLDSATNVIHTLTAEGRFVGKLALPGGGYFPSGLATDQQGRILVADTGLSRVLLIEPGGQPVTVIGQSGDDRVRLDQPTDLAPGPNGEIYIADTGKHRVVVFGADLSYLREWTVPKAGTLNGPHLAVAAQGVIVSDPEGGSLILYDFGGREQRRLGAGELIRPVGVTVDSQGNTYVADVEGRSVLKYAPW